MVCIFLNQSLVFRYASDDYFNLIVELRKLQLDNVELNLAETILLGSKGNLILFAES